MLFIHKLITNAISVGIKATPNANRDALTAEAVSLSYDFLHTGSLSVIINYPNSSDEREGVGIEFTTSTSKDVVKVTTFCSGYKETLEISHEEYVQFVQSVIFNKITPDYIYMMERVKERSVYPLYNGLSTLEYFLEHGIHYAGKFTNNAFFSEVKHFERIQEQLKDGTYGITLSEELPF